jgi:hypothetical protein
LRPAELRLELWPLPAHHLSVRRQKLLAGALAALLAPGRPAAAPPPPVGAPAVALHALLAQGAGGGAAEARVRWEEVRLVGAVRMKRGGREGVVLRARFCRAATLRLGSAASVAEALRRSHADAAALAARAASLIAQGSLPPALPHLHQGHSVGSRVRRGRHTSGRGD